MFDVCAFTDRFRQQYPQGSILSDLVQIHGDQYIVRVSIASAGHTLVSTLAADASLALAEDRATARALAMIGITQPITPEISIELLIPEQTMPLPEMQVEILAPAVTPIVETAPATKTSRAKKAPAAPDLIPEIVAEPAAISKLLLTESAPVTEQTLNVTDIIPLINMELKRLGWSKDQGRDYMVSLYNKRASALLSDNELFGLLQHLKDESIV